MTRGVNRNVIEISDTGNECFERAILFVRPDTAGEDPDTLRIRATKYLSQFKLRPWFYGKGQLKTAFVKIGAGALIGAAITALLLR